MTPAEKAQATIRSRYTKEEISERQRQAAHKAWNTRRARSAAAKKAWRTRRLLQAWKKSQLVSS